MTEQFKVGDRVIFVSLKRVLMRGVIVHIDERFAEIKYNSLTDDFVPASKIFKDVQGALNWLESDYLAREGE